MLKEAETGVPVKESLPRGAGNAAPFLPLRCSHASRAQKLVYGSAARFGKARY